MQLFLAGHASQQMFLVGIAPCGCIFECADPEVETEAEQARLAGQWMRSGLEVATVPSWTMRKRTALCAHGTTITLVEDEVPIIVKDSTSDFDPAPEGAWRAVCVDVVELGMVTGQYGAKPMIRLVFETEEINPKNKKPYMVRQRFGMTLSSKGRLRPFLESWRGKKFTEDELKGFDVETLIGVNVQLGIVHNAVEGKIYANISSVMKPARGMEKLAASPDYVRVKDRAPDNTNGHAEEPRPTDEDLAF